MNTYLRSFFVSVVLMTVFSGLSQTTTASSASAKEEDEFAKKKIETKLTEVIPTDSVSAGDLIKRAEAWFKAEHDNYKVSNPSTSSGKAECIASFPVKPKELNPQVDYTGKVTMKVLIECKNSKYRYTISEIRHTAKNGKSSGGSIDNVVPECGSQGMTDVVWKKLKGEALTGAAKVKDDLKIAMGVIPSEISEDDW